MALRLDQKEIIRILVKSDYYDAVHNPSGLSNRAIAKEANCSESAVRTLIRKEGLEKNAINALAKTEAQTIIIQDEIKERKNAFSDAEKNAYQGVLDTAKQTIEIASNFQKQIGHRQEADTMAIEALISLKAKELKEAKTPEDILKVNLRFREYLTVISDYGEIKKGVEANDLAMITKGEAPRHAPKSDTTVSTLTIVDTEAGTKGKW